MQKSAKSYFAIGLMSGSSLDGLDITYCKYTKDVSSEGQANWTFELLHAKTTALKHWELQLAHMADYSEAELGKLSKDFAVYMVEELNHFLLEYKIKQLDLVSSHGHTISHHPEIGKTCQIGDGQTMADLLGQTVVNNLRQRDVDEGGQGAPIVPIGDKHLFGEYQFCLNIGGIANISIKLLNRLIAFDVCSANQVLNFYALQLGSPFDKDGEFARKGAINKGLLQKLNAFEYYQKVYPKSLDNSYSKKLIAKINSVEINPQNALATYTEHIAVQLAKCIETLKKNLGLNFSKNTSLLVTGGGAFNSFLLERCQSYLSIRLHIPSAEIINYKEAIVMGFIGVLRLRKEVNVLASVTGANRDTSCGDIYNPKLNKLD